MSEGSSTESDLPRFKDLESEYEILRELGRGGTAVVYLARDLELGRKVAIKVIRSTYVEDREALARLIREAKTVASLQHPNIVMLYGTRRLSDGSIALLMQYVPGMPLKEVIRRHGPIPFDKSESILRDIGRALTYAHRRKIVHRDIKPENIYLDREAGMARLSDFGIARPWDTDSNLTLPGMAIGTPAYMSPEQIDGEELDGRSDLYSLGLVGYEMLAGRAPWTGENVYDTIFKQKHEALPPLSERRQGVPDNLELAIRGCLPKDRERRWTDARAFLKVLDGWRPAGATPLESQTWAESTRQDDGDPSRGGGEEGVAIADDAPTLRYRRGEGGAPRLEDAGGEGEGARIVEAADVDDDEPAGVEGALAREPGEDRRSGSGFMSGASRARRSRASAKKGRRWTALLVGGGVLLLATVAGLVLLRPGSFVGLLPDGVDPPFLSSSEGPGPEDAGAPAFDSAGVATAAEGDDAGIAAEAPAPGPPASLAVLSGDGQSGTVGDTLSVPIAVAVRDSSGRSVPGVSVEFSPGAVGGGVFPSSVEANDAGIAEATWRLGSGPGRQEVVVTVDGRPSPRTTLEATATPGEATRIEVLSGRGQAVEPGSRLPDPIRLRVTDDFGNPVEGASLSLRPARGQGSVQPSDVTTDEDGIAEVGWTVGGRVGSDTLRAYLEGASESTVTVVAGIIAPRLAPRPTIEAGGTHTCELVAGGQVECWGDNDAGQLGDGGTRRQTEATRVITGARLARLAAGVSFTCGLTLDGRARCWGANGEGQLGTGSTASSRTPEPVATDARFQALEAGAEHACGLTVGGQILCWGSNESGRLGNGTQIDQATPVPVIAGWTYSSLAVGWGHSCGLTRPGRAFCWGRNSSGELGDGTGDARVSPAEVSTDRRFESLAAGSAHTCGLTSAGELYCWGMNRYGQLGDGGQENQYRPVRVTSEEAFTSVVAGGVHTCALAEGGRAFCWGRNTYGQLGDGTNVDRSSPVAVAGDLEFTNLSSRGAHTCGRTVGGSAYCWGYNSDGQLGDGTRTTSAVPVRAGG